MAGIFSDTDGSMRDFAAMHETVSSYIDSIITDPNQKKDPKQKKESKQIPIPTLSADDAKTVINQLRELADEIVSSYSGFSKGALMQGLNAIYNFDAILNPIAIAIAGKAIYDIYISVILKEIYTAVLRITQLLATDSCKRTQFITRRTLSGEADKVRSVADMYDMDIRHVMNIYKAAGSKADTYDLTETITSLIEETSHSVDDRIQSANNIIDAVSRNDEWVGGWAVISKALAEEAANTVCIRIRHIIMQYTSVLASVLITGEDDDDACIPPEYTEGAIKEYEKEVEERKESSKKKAKDFSEETDNDIEEGKTLFAKHKFHRLSDLTHLKQDEREKILLYLNTDPDKAPSCLEYIVTPSKLNNKALSLSHNIKRGKEKGEKGKEDKKTINIEPKAHVILKDRDLSDSMEYVSDTYLQKNSSKNFISSLKQTGDISDKLSVKERNNTLKYKEGTKEYVAFSGLKTSLISFLNIIKTIK